jgi:hypothetical protein
MRLLAAATVLGLGAIIGLSPARAYQRGPRPPAPKVTNVNITYNFTFHSEIGKVRTVTPPESYDEKGNIKKHTKVELLQLKGDTPEEKKLTGYKAEFADVKVGDTVQVSISMLKGATKLAKKDKEETDTEKPKAKPGKWIVAQTLLGKVTKIDSGKTDSEPKMTIQVSTKVLGGGGGNVKTTQNFDAEKYKATLVVIGQRAPSAPGK